MIIVGGPEEKSTPRKVLEHAAAGLLLSTVGLMMMLAIGLSWRDDPRREKNEPQAPTIRRRQVKVPECSRDLTNPKEVRCRR